jgi:hypothetical protein
MTGLESCRVSGRGQVTVEVYSHDPLVVRIPELDLIGKGAHSPNKQFLIACAESRRGASATLTGGMRDSNYGVAAVIRNGELMWSHEVERPYAGEVSDTGVAVVADWGLGSGLKSTLLVYSPEGTTLIEMRVEANLNSCAITADGKYAAFTTCYAEIEDVSAKLFLFDVANMREMFRADFPLSRVCSMFAQDDAVVIQAEARRYRFQLDGTLTNALEIQIADFEAAMSEDNFDQAAAILKSRGNSSNEPEWEAFIRSGYRVILACSKASDVWAKCHKALGEISLASDDPTGAITHFEEALRLNPRIGLKKKLADLRLSMTEPM